MRIESRQALEHLHKLDVIFAEDVKYGHKIELYVHSLHSVHLRASALDSPSRSPVNHRSASISCSCCNEKKITPPIFVLSAFRHFTKNDYFENAVLWKQYSFDRSGGLKASPRPRQHTLHCIASAAPVDLHGTAPSTATSHRALTSAGN